MFSLSSSFQRCIYAAIDDTLFNPRFVLYRNPLVSLFKRAIFTPDDLAPLTTIAHEDEVEPESVGMTREDVKMIWRRVEDLYRTGISPGISISLRRFGRHVLHRAIGHSHGNGPHDADDSPRQLMSPTTPLCQFSASKAVTAILIHLLAEKNELHLLDPVSHYIPEFAANGKKNTTIYQILTHRGGIPRPPADANPELLYDPEAFVKVLCAAKPETASGRRMAYHAITGGAIMGEIIRRVTGMNIKEFLDVSIRRPLGFRWFTYGVSPEDHPAIATNYSTGVPLFFPLSSIVQRALSASWDTVVHVSNEGRFLQTIIPAGNLVATADEMCRFFQLLLNGGELDGKRILSPLTIQRATTEADNTEFDGTLFVPMRYSAGFMLGASPFGLWGPFTASAFGHIGFINIMCWADPDRSLAVSLQTTGKSLIGGHLWIIARLLTEIASRCRIIENSNDVGDVYTSYVPPVEDVLQKYQMAW